MINYYLCVDNTDKALSLTKGKVYRGEKNTSIYSNNTFIVVRNNLGVKVSYFANRFKLIKGKLAELLYE